MSDDGELSTLRSRISGPRWANFPGAIRDGCWDKGIEIVKLEVDKGWIRETIRFELKGPRYKLNELMRDLEASFIVVVLR